MRSKRLIAILLTLCLVMTVFAPAASAVEVGGSSYAASQKGESGKVNTSRPGNSLQLSGNNKTDIQSLRDQIQATLGGNLADKDFSLSLRDVRLDAVLEELKAASAFHSGDEKVNAFVVMEGNALAETHTSMSQVNEAAKRTLLNQQALVIRKIEDQVLAGAELTVRYQFTYLANAFSVLTEFDNLDEIAKIEGVKSVFLMPTYQPLSVSDTHQYSSGNMIGATSVWEDLEYTGAGMRIAVVDTGLDLDHPSFVGAPELTEDSMTVTDIDNVLVTLHAYSAMRGNLEAEDLYYSDKVPFAFNYIDVNLTADHSRDSQGAHGTHVAGIAAANKIEGSPVVGTAPDAQVIVMKVFGANGGAYMDDYIAAIEDAMTLDCDVVNLSLGSDNGFTDSGYAFVESVFANLENQDIIATISAGNSGISSTGNLWQTDMNRTQNPENGVVGSPSTYGNAFSIASAQNNYVMWENFILGQEHLFYMPSVEILYGYVNSFEGSLLSGGEDEEFEYVIIDGLGEEEDFYDAEGNSLVNGKIAVVKRGEINFSTKIVNAANAGAVACIIWNNDPEGDVFNFGMTTAVDSENEVYPSIPGILVSYADGQKMADAEDKTITVTYGMLPRQLSDGGQMSSFSSWGTTSDLRLVPDITGIGGNVLSTVDNGYGTMSGTSMSAPQLAGASALVLQALKEKNPELAEADDGTLREMALALLMSTADPVISSASGLEASPRQQGAGIVNVLEAITTDAFLTVDGSRPKVELKDNADGVYTFSFELTNMGSITQSYIISSTLLTEAAVEFVDAYGTSPYPGEYFMAGYDTELTGTVECGTGRIRVAAGKTAVVKVTVTLSAEDKEYFDTYWPNGGYVEGFIYLDNENPAEVDLNLPFFGFYGEWTDAPVFDTAMWYENDFWSAGIDANKDNYVDEPNGDQYYNVLWTSMGDSDWVVGMNPYSGPIMGQDGKILYDPSNNVLSPNGDGYMDDLDEIYLSLLRNVKELTVTWNVNGKVLQKDVMTNVGKTSFSDSYGQIIPWVGSWYYDGFFDGMADLADGDKLTVTFSAKIDYEGAKAETLSFDIYIDLSAPEVVEVEDFAYSADINALMVTVKDPHLAAITLLNPAGTRILSQVYDYNVYDNGDGTYTALMDITGLGTDFIIAVSDYGGNETYLDYSCANLEDNVPEMDTSLLYGYRVGDDIINEYMGYDYQFGWVSMNKPEDDTTPYGAAWVDRETDEHMEYYALNAAEYAGGKIFAFDAEGKFLWLEPGVWNRHMISNPGANVRDMAFDDTTDTMYVLVKDEQGSISLQTVDLLTGELTRVAPVYNDIWTLTIDDEGTMYTVKSGDGTLYSLSVVESPYYSYVELNPVLNAAGEEVVLELADGTEPAPYYAQSMTYSNGKIYWAYYFATMMGSEYAMFVIDTQNDFAYTASPYISSYPELGGYNISGGEYVGLLTLDPTDYQIPAAEELVQMNLSKEFVALKLGEGLQLEAFATPWNYEIDELVWSSSDESVATVNQSGRITTVGAGLATITVACGDVVASCLISVVDVQGYSYAYDFAYGTGFVQIDNERMESQLVAYAPTLNGRLVDFMVGDYNGHDGCFYGYDYNTGRLHKWNIATGECVAIGANPGQTINDMAYDYTTGLFYAVTYDMQAKMGSVSIVDIRTGELHSVAETYYNLIALAIDKDGRMFAINDFGWFGKIVIEDDGYGPSAEFYPMVSGLGELMYAQAMTYDWTNDMILWSSPESQTMYLIDYKAEQPYVLALGNPMDEVMFLTGLFTIPAELPYLPDVAVEDVVVSDMFMVTGSYKEVPVSILPLNANNCVVSVVSSDPSVALIYQGYVVALAPGEAELTVTVNDSLSAQPFVRTIHVTVLEAADNMYGFLSSDLSGMMGALWMPIYAEDPTYFDEAYVVMSDYDIYTAEYYDGKLYALGYSLYDYPANWHLFTMDPSTYEILDAIDLGNECPYIYDMTYDYTRSVMYCVAGNTFTDTDLYAIDLATGKLTFIMETPFLMSLAATEEGLLYAAENCPITNDMGGGGIAPLSLEAEADETAMIYKIDPEKGIIEEVGRSGVTMNTISSMSYDYDTGSLYWTGVDMSTGNGGLSIVDMQTGEAKVLGPITPMGGSVGGLFFICDNVPAEGDAVLSGVSMQELVSLNAGSTVQMNLEVLPFGLEAQVAWSSSNEKVATVDENGLVTGLARGYAEITATVTCNGKTLTAVCQLNVLPEGASFLTYNTTQKGWALISRADGSVTMLNSGEEAANVTALTMADYTVYGVDEDGQFFSLNMQDYSRNVIGTIAAADVVAAVYEAWGMTEEDYDLSIHAVELRDLAYDAKNDRILVLANVMQDDWGYMWSIAECIFEVSLADASVTLLMDMAGEFYYSGIQGIDMDANGMLYFYSALDDYYYRMDLETYEVETLFLLQRYGMTGAFDQAHDLYFDEVTDRLFHLSTQNYYMEPGDHYELYSMGATRLDFVIEQDELGGLDPDTELGDHFSGLVYLDQKPDYQAAFTNGSASLGGNLGLNFYFALSEDLANAQDAKVVFTYAGGTAEMSVGEAKYDSEYDDYRFTIELNAKQMTDKVTAQVYVGDQPVGEAKEYSIQQYAQNMLAKSTTTEEVKTLLKAMLNYGAAAQLQFNYKTDDLANAVLEAADRELADVDTSALPQRVVTGTSEVLTFNGCSLLLGSGTSVRAYFLYSGNNIDEVTFTVNGETVKPVYLDGEYYVELTNIAASDLSEMITFVADGITVEYNAMAYVRSKLDGTTADETLRNMVKALYAYAAAAEAYFG